MNIYREFGASLSKGQVKQVIAFLNDLSISAQPKDNEYGICLNLHDFMKELQKVESIVGSFCSGYTLVSCLSVGFNELVAHENNAVRRSYPLGYTQYMIDSVNGTFWVKGNARTRLCSHLASELQTILEKGDVFYATTAA